MLGGKDNSAIDRENRAFLGQAARFLTAKAAVDQFLDADARRETRDVSGRMIQQQMAWRDREQVAGFFAGTDLAEPGLVRVEEWRPGPGPGETDQPPLWCAVGRKR